MHTLNFKWDETCKEPLMRTEWRCLKNVNIELPYDTGIPLLGIHPEKTIIQKYTCTRMFITALFTIARSWKQPKRPSTDQWIKKLWYIYRMEYYSATKKNEIMPFASTWMQLEIIILSELSQRHISYDITYMWNLKINDTNELFYKTNKLTNFENKLMVTKGEMWEGEE